MSIHVSPEKLFLSFSENIPNANNGKMFGALCIKTPKGKAAAMFWKDELVVKLPKEHLTTVLSWDGTKFFDPMDGRPMKEWVQVPFHYADQWKSLVEKAMEFVSGQK